MLYFELLFNKKGEVVSTPETKKTIPHFRWMNFKATAYRFIMRDGGGIYNETSERFARKMLGDARVNEYISFCDALAIKYMLEEAAEENHCDFYTSYPTASENFTQGFHLALSNGRVTNDTWLVESDDSTFDDIHKLIER